MLMPIAVLPKWKTSHSPASAPGGVINRDWFPTAVINFAREALASVSGRERLTTLLIDSLSWEGKRGRSARVRFRSCFISDSAASPATDIWRNQSGDGAAVSSSSAGWLNLRCTQAFLGSSLHTALCPNIL
eukprot:Hpha_TRINITY_DN19702_c0_g1::TRINITY_DN19702_c0_g1_i1::g.21751::m.21751